MGTKTTQPINLRGQLHKLMAGLFQLEKKVRTQQTFWFSGNSSQVDFALPPGWKPKQVFVDGALYRPGSGDDYEVKFDGNIHSISFAVAPAIVDIAIIAEEI